MVPVVRKGLEPSNSPISAASRMPAATASPIRAVQRPVAEIGGLDTEQGGSVGAVCRQREIGGLKSQERPMGLDRSGNMDRLPLARGKIDALG